MNSHKNLIVFIIGTTASGKTKLSLNLSTSIDYEIISCDSMQIYKTANIMTAKATISEQESKPHHGIDLIDLDQQGFNRNNWLSYCRKTVNDIQVKTKIPVIVGGTTYYMEPLLFKTNQSTDPIDQSYSQDIEIDENNLLDQLKLIDPLAAQKFHVNDFRRIKNAIKFFKQTGKLPSQVPDFHSPEASLQLDNFLIFWPKWKSKTELNQKLKTRIHSMIYDDGGLEEIIKIFEQLHDKPQETGGVLQSIGYRQFDKVYELHKQNKKDVNEMKIDEDFVKLLQQSEAQLLQDTITYTRKQLQWIKNRIICNPNIDLVKERLFILEFETEDQFQDCVIKPAREIFSAFVEGSFQKENFKKYMLSDEQLEEYKNINHLKQRQNWNKQKCECCQREVNGPLEWKQHLKSRQHDLVTKKLKKKEQKQQKQELKQNDTGDVEKLSEQFDHKD